MTGPGGIGKTRLALRLADQVARAYSYGAWLVDLAAVETEESIAHTVGEALDLDIRPGVPALAALVEHLRGKRILIVLDNCEHVVMACGFLAKTLLAGAPGLQIIATSRQALRVDGEYLLTVSPLAAPHPEAASPPEHPYNESLELFIDRGARALGTFTPTPDEKRTAALICHRLEGIPLAIELAAARLRVLTCAQILERLDDRFKLLTRGYQAAPARQQTLRAALDWSFELCDVQERLLWGRLSVFCDGFDLEAVEAVCSGEGLPREHILDLVTSLAEKSVLVREEHDANVRYRMLETLRQYGHHQLCKSADSLRMQRRHRDYYDHLVYQAETEWFSRRQSEWFAHLYRERRNVRAAMNFSLSQPEGTETALAMAASLWSYRLGAGGLGEERHWLTRSLALPVPPGPARIKALWADGWLALLCGDTATATDRVHECHTRAKALDEPQWTAHAEQLAGLAALFRDDFTHAITLLEKALGWFKDQGMLSDTWATLFLLSLACCLSDDPRGMDLAQECLALCETHDAQWSRAHALWILGLHHWLRGDAAQAVRLARESLRLHHPSHNRLAVAQCLELMAWARTRQGNAAEAAELLGTAQCAWEQLGALLPGVGHLLHHRTACEQQLRAELGEILFTKRTQTGAGLNLEEAVARALGQADTRDVPAPRAGTPGLTTRETEVARLLSQGLTDKQIAARLVISPRTAQGHVQRMLRKLGFTTRTQVAAWWLMQAGTE